ncbi:hypothetical protein [Paenibacillus tuaregi]|uniref:hypothetical protein n=1 Tax=Paenibacillus tuaregi TaxID=1816681 RepID=UPI000838556D|nr:hypothetical protein [Paenibacillus tuaregi]
MLSDFGRKTLRILYNYISQQRRMPTEKELERLTGRSPADIVTALNELMLEEYIYWPDKPAIDTIVILEAWERSLSGQSRATVTSQQSSSDYWTEY